jgi:hypothetical protein
MRKRIAWLPAIAVLALLGTTALPPAFARGSAGGFGGLRASSAFAVHGSVHGRRTFARSRVGTPRFIGPNRAFIGRNVGFRNDFRLGQRNQFLDAWPIAAWPYSWPMDDTPVTVGGSPSSPSVIVISGVPNSAAERTVPQTPPDYSYVAGCRAVPNGYHCDVSPQAGAKP